MGRLIRGNFGKKPFSKPERPARKKVAPVLQHDFRHEVYVADRMRRKHEWLYRVEKYGFRADTSFHVVMLFRLEPHMIDEAVASLHHLPKRLFDWEKLSEDERFASVVAACTVQSESIPDFVQRLKKYRAGVMLLIDSVRKRGEDITARDRKLYLRAQRIMRGAAEVKKK